MRDLNIPCNNPESREELRPVRYSPAFAPRAVRNAVRRTRHRTIRQNSRAGFTLIEMMIALSVFALLMTVVFVPLTQAVSTFNAGRADIELQQAAQQTMNQIESELKKAVHVYPNDEIPGVTDRLPYKNSVGLNPSSAPYYASTNTTCDPDTRVGNTSRLDFLVGATDGPDQVLKYPIEGEKFIVSFYGRRVDTTKDYNKEENPIGLFRAQMPYVTSAGAAVSGMNVGASRYPSSVGTCDAGWLKQERHNSPTIPDEINLEPFALNDAGSVMAAHSLLTASGIGLPAPNAQTVPPTSMTPNLSFICADVNNDGKIDRVTVNLLLEQYESSSNGQNGEARRHEVRLTQTIDLPNVR